MIALLATVITIDTSKKVAMTVVKIMMMILTLNMWSVSLTVDILTTVIITQ